MAKKLKVMLDAGHGPNTPGKRSPDGMREYEFNKAVADAMKAELARYDGVGVYFTHDDGRDVPLKERTDRANRLGVDVFVSLHANALAGRMGDHGGIETFAHTSKPAEAVKLAQAIQSALIKATGLRNRGVKYANFHVLRETKMTAILIEHGFMDSTTDLPKLKSKDYRELCGKTNAETLAKFYGLKKKEKPKKAAAMAEEKTKYYRVVTGSFTDRKNAENRIEALEKAGFKSFIDIYEK